MYSNIKNSILFSPLFSSLFINNNFSKHIVNYERL